jgi:hypothetical protein
MHVLRALCVLLAVLPPALGEVATFVDVSSCDGRVSLEGAVDNDVLYNQVFNWMHQKKISNWTHRRVDATAALRAHFELPANATLACAKVSYSAELQLPGTFKAFLEHLGLALDLPISVRKTVCNTGAAIVEQAEVDEAVVRRVYIDTTHDVTEAGVRSSTDVRLEVPWYAKMLTRLITQHIGASVGERNRAVTASLCTPGRGPALLARNASFLTPPREAHMRHWRGADDTPPRLWKLRREATASLQSSL